jgi:hypothetical protein
MLQEKTPKVRAEWGYLTFIRSNRATFLIPFIPILCARDVFRLVILEADEMLPT